MTLGYSSQAQKGSMIRQGVRAVLAAPIAHALLLSLLVPLPASLRGEAAATPAPGDPYCDGAALWSAGQDPENPPAPRSWGSAAGGSSFRPGPCLRVSGIGITETQYRTVLVLDRSDFQNTYLKLPGGEWAYAQELSLQTGRQRALSMLGNAFCSTGLFTRNGTFMNIGGGNPGNGGVFVRTLRPCADGSCDFVKAGEVTAQRWYPTSQLLPDGRAIIVGGCKFGADLNYKAINTPSVEYWPRKPGETNFTLPFLKATLPFNLYPFLHLLPSGRLFLFAADRYILLDTLSSQQVGDAVALDRTDAEGSPIFRSYPLSGTSVLFPIIRGFPAEIMVCGGGSKRAKPRAGHEGDAWVRADDKCYRIQPEADKPEWVQEKMKAPRVMSNAVLLPTGQVLIINGAQTGYAGTPNNAHQPVLTPELYDTTKKEWYQGDLASSRVPRVYHASALLLHDATVLITGSNPNSKIVMTKDDFPTEFRTEFFVPPYLAGPGTPRILTAPFSIRLRQSFVVTFAAPLGLRRIHVVLSYPGFSTHGSNHGMRNVVLKASHTVSVGTKYVTRVKAPSSYTVAPPTWYWLFVVVDGKPNRDGHTITVL